MALVDARGFQLTPNAGQAIGQGVQAAQGVQGILAQRNQLSREEQLRQAIGQGTPEELEKARGIDPQAVQQFEQTQLANDKAKFNQIEEGKRRELSNFVLRSERASSQGTPEQQEAFLRGEAQKILAINPNADVTDTLELADAVRAGRGDARFAANRDFGTRTGILQNPQGGLTAEQREFSSLTEGLPEDQKQKAKLIKLGLSPRAQGSAIQTIADKDIAALIGDTEATIGQRKRFGELTGSSRAKAIDKGFERIVKIDTGIGNIDRAISLLQGGAKTGAIERFLPTIRAASVELDQVQKSMALDVIGAVTFGALSKGELDLAKEVAFPPGLDEPALIEHLQERKDAQLKLRSYFQDQIDHLDQGGTVASFLRKKEDELSPQVEQSPPEQAALPQGITEEDIIETMRVNNMTREQVMQRLKNGG